MSRPSTVRSLDPRAALRRGGSRDRAEVPAFWHRRMLEALALLFGLAQAAGAEAWWDRPGHAARAASAYGASAEAAADRAGRLHAHADGRGRDRATGGAARNRGLGERVFSPHERDLLAFVQAELGRLLGEAPPGATDPAIARLSPRLRQTFACLIEGDSEKQVAARLGLSHATVHQYVTALYRHFAVQSRAQLLAWVIRSAHM